MANNNNHSQPKRVSWRHSNLLLGVVVFLLALIPRTLDLDVFVGPDEFHWSTGVANFTNALATGDLRSTYYDGPPGVTLMWVEALGSGINYGLGWLQGNPDWEAVITTEKTIDVLAERRQIVGVAGAILVAVIAVMTAHLFGWQVGWLSGLLLVFDPFLLTESRVLRTEGLLTYLVTIALLCLLFFWRQPSSKNLILTAVLAAVAVLSKVSALALLPVSLSIVSLRLWQNNTTEQSGFPWWPLLSRLLLWALIFAGTIFVLWPALWVAPGYVGNEMYDFTFLRAVEGGGGAKTFLLGELYPDEDPGLLFYPTVLVFRTSPILWFGIFLLPVLWLWSSRFSRYKSDLLIMAAFLISHLILISMSFLKEDRYALSIFPTITIMASLGYIAAWNWLTSKKPILAPVGWLFIGGLGLAQLYIAIPHHPYYYTYWNPLVGGAQAAVNTLPVGTGSEGIDQLADYLNTLPAANRIKLASANSQKIAPLFSGETIAMANLDGKWVQGDYVMIHISQLQRGKHAKDILEYLSRDEPIFTVSLSGLEYAWLYPGPAAQFYGGGHKLEGRGTLFGYNLCAGSPICQRSEPVIATAGDSLYVTLFWRNEGQLETDRFFVRLMDIDGYVWAEAIVTPRPGFLEASHQENAIVEGEAVLNLPPGIPAGEYFFKPGFRTEEGEIIGYFELPGDTKPIQIRQPQNHLALPAFEPENPRSLEINNELRLDGYDLSLDRPEPGSETWLTLYWRATSNVTRDYVILLRLLDEAGIEIAYWLGRPVRSGYPTTGWQAGQIVQDPWRLEIPPETPLGRYEIEIALFDAETESELERQILGYMEIQWADDQ